MILEELKNKILPYFKTVKTYLFSISYKLFNIIIIPIVISILVALMMEDYFSKQQIKKDITIKITSLEDEVIKYNELFINNFPLQFLNNLENNLIVYDYSLKIDREKLQKLIHKGRGNSLDRAFAEYFLKYTTKNIVDPHSAYLKISIKLGAYEEKYKHIQSKLKIIKEKVKILNTELQCNDNKNILNKLINEFNKRENFHNNAMSHILKVYNAFNTKYKDKYIDIHQYEQLISDLTPPYVWDYKYKSDDTTLDNLIIDFIKINSKYISEYNKGIININEYCKEN